MHALAEPAIVGDVAVGEQHAAVADDRLAAAALGAGVDRHALADQAIGADPQPRRLALVFEVLRRVADRGEREDAGAGADVGVAGDDDMREQLDAVAERDLRPDMAERPDLDALAETRAGLDDGARMDRTHAGTSIADTSASQTSTPSTLASPRNHQMLRRLLIFVMCSLQLVAGHDGLAELRLVDRHQQHVGGVGVEVLARRAQGAGGLRHRLDDEHARHHRPAGEMAHELRLVDGDVLDADAVFVAARLDDAVDEQERIAMRKHLQEALDVETFNRPPGRLVHHALHPTRRRLPAHGLRVKCAAAGLPAQVLIRAARLQISAANSRMPHKRLIADLNECKL